MTAKEQKIKEAYGEHWLHADINGWMRYGAYCPADLGFTPDEVDRYGNIDLWRPKSLQHIEDNFGWKRIDEHEPTQSEGDRLVGIADIEKFLKAKAEQYNCPIDKIMIGYAEGELHVWKYDEGASNIFTQLEIH